jgi:cysteinyl-tRNA synthetase
LDLEQKNSQGDQADSFIELLITLRTQFRDEKNFAMSDFIRDELEKLGVSIEDSNDGTEWDFS